MSKSFWNKVLQAVNPEDHESYRAERAQRKAQARRETQANATIARIERDFGDVLPERARRKAQARRETQASATVARIERDFGDVLPTGRARRTWRKSAIKEWSHPHWGEKRFRLALASLQRAKAENTQRLERSADRKRTRGSIEPPRRRRRKRKREAAPTQFWD